MRLRHIHSITKQFRLLLWRILDAIDRKFGLGPGNLASNLYTRQSFT